MSKHIDLNKPFAFHCKTHGLVFVKARDHIGENEEREHSPHLAKWRDIPQEQWIKEKN